MRDGRIHIARIPQDKGIDDESERSELIFLPLAIALPHFTTLTVEDCRRTDKLSFAFSLFHQNRPKMRPYRGLPYGMVVHIDLEPAKKRLRR